MRLHSTLFRGYPFKYLGFVFFYCSCNCCVCWPFFCRRNWVGLNLNNGCIGVRIHTHTHTHIRHSPRHIELLFKYFPPFVLSILLQHNTSFLLHASFCRSVFAHISASIVLFVYFDWEGLGRTPLFVGACKILPDYCVVVIAPYVCK